MSARSVTRIGGVVLGVALAMGACTTSSTSDRPASTTATPTPDPGQASIPLARYADYQSQNYDDPAHWLCRPEADDACKSDLDTTIIRADGTIEVEPFEAATDPPVDCFYVYPTISRDETVFSDWDASADEEGYVVVNQAARLRSVCRVYAPVYRQATLTSLVSRLGGSEAAEAEVGDPYADVLDAFRTYMAEDNDGRGVVLIGHSQGAGMLGRLIADEIDPNADVRDRLVSAYLAGSAVRVPEGADVGGQFQHVALCRSPDQVGCVVTWSSYRAGQPPGDGAFFGKPRAGDGVAACNNPAALDGGQVELDGYYPSDRSRSILGGDGPAQEVLPWLDAAIGAITTPFVALPGLTIGECASTNGYHYLAIASVSAGQSPRADDIGGDLTPEWGLHLVDVNAVMGDIVALVRSQGDAFVSR